MHETPAESAHDDVVELRVHGVGGPQGAKILGWTSESDIVTLATQRGSDGKQIPPDASSRFVRPLHEETGRPRPEAYEWGALTTGSGWNLLWIVFLPFTMLNVSGWARAQERRVELHRTIRDLAPRMLGYLATATYVLWIAYITLELAGAQWQARLVNHDGWTGWLGRNLLPGGSVIVFLGLLVALAFANVTSGTKFENANPDRPAERKDAAARSAKADLALRVGQIAAGGVLGAMTAHAWLSDDGGIEPMLPMLAATAVVALFVAARVTAPEPSQQDVEEPDDERHGQPPQHWGDDETAVHRNFFAHHRSLERLRHRHFVVAAATAGFALWLAAAGRNDPSTRLGLMIVAMATLQVVSLAAVWMCTLAGLLSGWSGAKERFTRAGFLSLGIVLCHAVFAGIALWLRERLATIPATKGEPIPLPVGPELTLTNQFFIALAVGVACFTVAALLPAAKRERAKGAVVKVARRMPTIGVVVAFVFVATFFAFSVREAAGTFESNNACDDAALTERLQCWYGDYDVGSSNSLQDLGAKVLLLLPVAIALSIRTSSSVGRVLGNIWDVLTFWPRRYHPLAVPPYAERAVPELRRHIELLLEGKKGVIVAGHSQGSVLSAAAVGPLLPAQRDRLFLLSFGSPLGTLYGKVFPIAIGKDILTRCVREPLRGPVGPNKKAPPERWRVLWRMTDPIGGPVFDDEAVDEELADPPDGDGWGTPLDVDDRPPLDRPPPWGVTRGHGWYPSEVEYRDTVERAAQLVRPPGA